MVKLLLLFGLLGCTTSATAQIRRGTGLLTHTHGPALRYTRTIMLTIKPEFREQFLQATSELQTQGARDPDCLAYHYYEDPVSRNSFLLLSEWRSAAALQAHNRQPYAATYLEQLPVWSTAPATVRLAEIVNYHTTTLPLQP